MPTPPSTHPSVDAPAHAAGHGRERPVIVLDFGGQYARLIARRIRDLGTYAEVRGCATPADSLRAAGPSAIVLSGGPASVHEPGAPGMDPAILNLGVPVLGICYGMQLLARELGGRVERTGVAEYGRTALTACADPGALVGSLPPGGSVWMSHRDAVVEPPPGTTVRATSPEAPVAAFDLAERRLHGVQFHPEVAHTGGGDRLLEAFLRLADAPGGWDAEHVVEEQVARIREQVGDTGRAVCGLSGGVDSAVAAALVHRAIGDRLTCVFVDHGLLRAGEAQEVVEAFGTRAGMRLVHVDASQRFLLGLAGVVDPEQKRRSIGATFVRVFEEQARALAADVGGPVEHLVQGTLYSDVIESGGTAGVASAIKSHHNVGGLPADMQLRLVEPLRMLFKDEARAVGSRLGLPDAIVHRQPFPGPGLAIRILGDVTLPRLEIVRHADAVLRSELDALPEDERPWQYFTVLAAGMHSVGVQGDARSYAHPVIIRAVTSEDAMTADWARLPHELLARISSRITNEVEGVNRVLLDITSKPPATIEWE